jgi:hypothetical protein
MILDLIYIKLKTVVTTYGGPFCSCPTFEAWCIFDSRPDYANYLVNTFFNLSLYPGALFPTKQ